MGRARGGLAHAALQSGRAGDRRRGRRDAGNARRAARQADQARDVPGALGRAQRAHEAREGARLSTREAALWGSADYEGIAQRFAPVHEQLVERLAARAGDAWLDVATGTGGVALRAAA